jgi:nitroreductase
MLSRRTLLITGGAFTLAAGGGYMLSRGPDHDAAAAALWSPRDLASFEGLVHYATLAANSHNAQGWRFRQTADGVTILPDMTRALPVADADHHHLYASLGCAAENLKLAAGTSGRSSALDFVPEGAGQVEIALAQGGTPDPLFEVILSRQCTRSDYDGRAVPVAELAALEAAARVDGAEVMLITDPTLIAQVLDLILTANAAQVSDPAFAAELKSWLRFNASAAVETGDGLFSATSGNPTLPGFLGRFMFDRFFTVQTENDRYARQVRSSAGLAIIHSNRDDPAHWVQAGRACQRFALQATALGIRHAHLNQPVEVANIRPQLQSLLGLGDRRPNMVLRFGYAPPMPRSLRRPVADVIEGA